VNFKCLHGVYKGFWGLWICPPSQWLAFIQQATKSVAEKLAYSQEPSIQSVKNFSWITKAAGLLKKLTESYYYSVNCD